VNVALRISCIVFTVQPSIWQLTLGCLVWTTLAPFAEAAEQTIIQKLVPEKRQGRVFGFAQSLEQSASPITAFLIGPIAQLIFIPFMTTGAGVDLIGGWFGVGAGRGIALVFIISGMAGLIVTLIAMRSESYHLLSQHYTAVEEAAPLPVAA
jgi:DHA3 family multidrug efflux protein-like MFS transporter